MRLLLLSLTVFLVLQTPSQAGHLRRGGCSDPCASGGCGHTRACIGCGQARQTYTGASYHSHAGGACQTCGMSATTTYAPAQSMGYSVTAADVAVAPQLATQPSVDCQPVTTYQVVLQPEYFSETRPQAVTEYRDETRYRTRTVARQVPVEVQDYRTTTVMTPKTETKTVDFQVVVPKTGEKTVEVVESVPVWNEVTETYTVRVPRVVDVQEEYTVQVAKLRDESFSYTVYVPQVQREQKIQRVTNVVPVTKSRTIQVARPVTRMTQQTRDYGHWEVRVEAAPQAYAQHAVPNFSGGCGPVQMGGCGTSQSACAGCGGCGSAVVASCGGYTRSTCGSCGGCGIASSSYPSGYVGGCGAEPASASCGPATTTRRVWVPNVVSESVPITENVVEEQLIHYTAFEQQVEEVPYECTYMVYAPEERTGTRQVVTYEPESRTRTRKVVEYDDEERTRVRKELKYEDRTRTQTIPFVKYVTENRTKEVSYTVNIPETKVEPFTRTTYETIQEELSEEYTVRVPVTVYKEVQVQVCRMVPKLVPVTVQPCKSGGPATTVYGGGCSNCLPARAAAPQTTGCASCGTAPCTSCQ